MDVFIQLLGSAFRGKVHELLDTDGPTMRPEKLNYSSAMTSGCAAVTRWMAQMAP